MMGYIPAIINNSARSDSAPGEVFARTCLFSKPGNVGYSRVEEGWIFISVIPVDGYHLFGETGKPPYSAPTNTHSRLPIAPVFGHLPALLCHDALNQRHLRPGSG